MSVRNLSRAAIVVGTTVAVVFGGATAAFAGNTAECVSVGGHSRGCITHIDDGDVFRVCDNYVDGKGVYGAVQEYAAGRWNTMGQQTDGGDAGCDKFGFDVTEEDYDKYRLKVCWNGTCEYDAFRE